MLHTTKLFDLDFTTHTIPQISQYILQSISQNKSNKILPASMADIILCQENKPIFQKISTFDIKTMDGMPLVFLARAKTNNKISRGYGPNLMLQVFKDSQSLKIKHFLYGGTPETLDKLQHNLSHLFPKCNIVGRFVPPFRELNHHEEQELIKMIKKQKPNIVWVGVGSVKQINFISQYSPLFPHTTFIAVGAAFDFISKVKRQAPLWMQNCGLEWFFRLLEEPNRLFKRYVFSIPKMGYLFLKEYFYIKMGSCQKRY